MSFVQQNSGIEQAEQRGEDMIADHMAEKQFDFINNDNKQFIIEFTKALEDLGYIRRRNRQRILLGQIHADFQKSQCKIKKSDSPYLYQG